MRSALDVLQYSVMSRMRSARALEVELATQIARVFCVCRVLVVQIGFVSRC
jgi:hypothetical protein